MSALAEEEPRWLIGTEAGSYARVNTSTMYRWIRLGRVRATKVGGRWYMRRADLDALLSGELA
jgi:excisionase family DNA binding protein